jgi:hypothetical protein
VAQLAACGFQPGTGSFAGELEESLIDRELDLLTSRRNASAEAAGLKRAGHYAMTNAAFGAVGALLNGGANVAGHNAGMQAAGG